MRALFDIFGEAWQATRGSPGLSLLATLILCAGWIAAISGIVMSTTFNSPNTQVIPADLHIVGEVRGDITGQIWGADALALREKLAVAAKARTILLRSAITNVSDGFRPSQNDAVWVDGPLFSELGWQMAKGQDFQASDFSTDSEVIIISHRFWLEQFAGARNVIGSSIQVEGKSRRIIGILPPNRAFPYQQRVYLPTRFSQGAALNARYLTMLIRMDASLREQVLNLVQQVAADAKLRSAEAQAPDVQPNNQSSTSIGASLFLSNSMNRETKFVIGLSFVFSLLLLALAACNAGGLLLIRWVLRSAELATRASLGATTTRLSTAAIVQALIISLASLALALVMSGFLSETVQRALHRSTNGTPEYMEFTLRVQAFWPLLTALVLTMVVIAVPVVWRLARGNLNAELKRRERGLSADYRTGKVLLFLQCVFAVASLALAVMCLLGEHRAKATDFGFASERVLVTTIRHADPLVLQRFVDTLSERLRSERKVQALTVGLSAPQYAVSTRLLMPKSVASEQLGKDKSKSPKTVTIEFVQVAPDFNQVYPTQLLAGSWFAANAVFDDKKLIINRDMAEQWFGSSAAAISQFFNIPELDGKTEKRYQIIGVVENARFDIVLDAKQLVAYAIAPRDTFPLQILSILANHDNPKALIPRLEQLALDVDDSIALSPPLALSERLLRSTGSYRLVANLFLPLGLLAVIMAASGFASLLATLIAQRLRDCSLRRALGAPATKLVLPMLTPLMLSFSLGLLVGLLAVSPLLYQLNKLIYGQSLPILLILLITVGLLLFAVALACVRPVWRALSADPMEILRQI